MINNINRRRRSDHRPVISRLLTANITAHFEELQQDGVDTVLRLAGLTLQWTCEE